MSGLPEMMREAHQKQNALADGCIQVIIPPSIDDSTQIYHHRFDQKAEWFRVTMASQTAQGEEPILQVSDRFKKLCNPSAHYSLGQYPSLVSFIGDTGVGKSTLVRAMNTVGIVDQMQTSGIMDWSQVFGCQLHGPVTRSTSGKKSTRPTSVGVHLYRDQVLAHVKDDHGNQEDVPILYADCEGFSAGSMKTDAERSTSSNIQVGSRTRAVSISSQVSQSRLHTEAIGLPEAQPIVGMEGPLLMDLVIKTPGFKELGKTSADVFYARFLYAFSDVIVFVINEEQKMKREMQRLLEWAVSAVKTSVRRSSPRTLLVVRNGPRDHHDSFYDDVDLKNEMFNDFGEIWDDSCILSAYKIKHDFQCSRTEDKIHDNDQYFGLFFRQTKICYIPSMQNRQPPDRVYQQYSHLRKLIVEGVQSAQKARSKSYFRHDVASAINLTNRAFRHFAEYDEPFDFHVAARKDNPTPISIPGHIANLLRHLGTTVEKFAKFEVIVAIGLVAYNFRSSALGREPEEIFDDELRELCYKGLQIYQKQFLRCALWMDDGTRCVNYAYNHEHHESGKNLIWKGSIDRSSFGKEMSVVVADIKKAFIDFYSELWNVSAQHGAPTLERTSAYRRRILGRERSLPDAPIARVGTLRSEDFDKPDGVWSTVKSNMSCFACLQYAPDHVLPCGHGFCEDCIKDFGKVLPQRSYHYALDECILCGTTAVQWHAQQKGETWQPERAAADGSLAEGFPSLPQIARLNPRCGGIRVLTLDGGGVRGIIELALIEKIEQRTGLNLPISEFFDLVVGTSTGGIISLAITSSTKDTSSSGLSAKFLKLAEMVFKKDRFGELWKVDPLNLVNKSKIANIMMALRLIKSRYKSGNLKASLLDFFDKDQPIFGGSVTTCKQRTTRVAVTSTSDGEPCLFTNYSRASYDREDLSDRDHLVDNKGFERQDNPENEARVWEAAMATSAAPGYFREWRIDDPENRRQGKVPFRDGALHSNLPVQCALEEQDRIWPAHKGYKKPLDILVSLGTGKQLKATKIPGWMKFAGVEDVAAAYYKNVVNTDVVWEAFSQSQSKNFSPHRHFRLTVDLEEPVGLDEWDKMGELIERVSNEYAASEKSKHPTGLWNQVETVAYKLTASLLFFEPERCDSVPVRGRGREEVSGNILCRLQTPSVAIRNLIYRIDGFYHQTANRHETPIHLRRDWKDALLLAERTNQPFVIPCRLDNMEGDTVPQSLLVKLKPPAEAGQAVPCPISGFPVTYKELKAGMLQRGIQ
ncbi:uncharacterized protein Z519_06582 [Cladophialophora bantiana CBS 173.52]|uniref:PNPLA domain-containing protein n=1 Tax=Cladophialophora bantiana (strain ATCC 10958 / CBS 173.52 / CDC B-1940 / NIH 8579) TaxID=1442370 RepID=A0A0D2I7B3_CLAB1|nr:uncharacterized protein Z519_06582 [Cladophialophora bantiana CBS 173.52]KIW92734.1 hypothetical protein Z519_06582 [Cladophialophora bantiana CBS 173.52]